MKRLIALIALTGLLGLNGCGLHCEAAEITPVDSRGDGPAAGTSDVQTSPNPASNPDNVMYWPLYEKTENSKTVLYPFYVREGDFRMMFPFYYRTNQGHDQHFLWPLVKIGDGKLTRLLPVWFKQDDGTFTLFPLMRQSPESTFWLVPPLYMRHDGSFFAAYPFYARGENYWFVFPSIYRSTADGDTLRVWPLYYHHFTADEQKRRVLFATHEHNEYRDTVSALLYYNEKDLKSGDSEMFAFPYYRARNGQGYGGCDSVLPLFLHHWDDTEQEQTYWVFPYYQSISNTSHHRLIPLIFNWEERTRMDGEQVEGREKSFSILSVLYRRHETFDAQDQLRTRKRGFLIFSDDLNAQGKRTFRMFGLPIVERNL